MTKLLLLIRSFPIGQLLFKTPYTAVYGIYNSIYSFSLFNHDLNFDTLRSYPENEPLSQLWNIFCWMSKIQCSMNLNSISTCGLDIDEQIIPLYSL